jgi:CDP-diacylglycerol---glycerol-3-phosphate 3-phosphatidyltransferase
VATLVPMFMLQPAVAETSAYPFTTWGVGALYFPWWVLVLIVGREVFMTWFRAFAQRRGVVIAAQRLGKWKAGFQYTWIGAAFLWFALKLLFDQRAWHGATATFWAHVVGMLGLVTMTVAFLLTGISLLDYLVRHRAVFTRPSAP